MGARGREGEKACVCVRACTCRRDGVKNKQGKGSDKHSPNLIQASGDSKNQNERNDVAHHKPAGGGVPGVRGTGQQVQPMPDQCAQQGAGRRKSRRSRPRETMLTIEEDEGAHARARKQQESSQERFGELLRSHRKAQLFGCMLSVSHVDVETLQVPDSSVQRRAGLWSTPCQACQALTCGSVMGGMSFSCGGT